MDNQELVASGGARERNKAKRRGSIVDSTLELLRVLPLAEVSVEQIAVRAGVAPATVYNLVGTREQLLIACVDRLVEKLTDALMLVDPVKNPVGAALTVIELSCEAFIVDREAFCQIVSAVNGSARSGDTLTVDPGRLQIAAMRCAKDQGLLREDVDPVAVGRQVYLSYNGALFAWVAGQLSDDGLRAATRHGLWTALAAFGADDHRDEFLMELGRAGEALVKAGYGIPR